jgi:hypothetical protein
MSGDASGAGDAHESVPEMDDTEEFGATESAPAADADGMATDGSTAGPPFDTTMVAVGTSVMWGTGNAYENKFVDLVHRDLNGGYPLDEAYLHFNPGAGQEPSKPRYPYDEPPNTDIVYPNGSYYNKTVDDGYTTDSHPKGPHLPPSRLRARGGAIIGLSPPAKVAVGDTSPNAPCGYGDDRREYNDQGGYLADEAKGTYDGKLDGLGKYASLSSKYANPFDKQDINRSKWLLMRDIGWGWPTIADQIQQFDPGGQPFSSPVEVPISDQPDLFDYRLPKQAPRGENVDLVLVDGGTNDMQLGWLNNPLKSERSDIKAAAKLYFYDNMTGENMPGEKGLLRRAREAFPNAVIVVLGYPVWTSNRTDIGRADEFLTANSWLGSLATEQALDNPLNFSHFQAHYLRRAVAEVAREDDGPGMVFAPPGYGVVNSMMADWPWSFGVKPDDHPVFDVRMISVDDVRPQREAVCDAEIAWERQKHGEDKEDCGREVGVNVACTAAGVGHPNNEGSRQYADTIVRRYKEYVDLPVGDNAEEYDDGTASLRQSLERYGVGPDGSRLQSKLSGSDVGTRFGLSQRVVDSMRIVVETDRSKRSEGGFVDTGRVRLGAWPGRRGEAGEGAREQFVLDTESRNFLDRDEFYVDPMMRRGLTGPVGNIDVDEDAAVKGSRTEPNEQTVHPPGHWSDRRLRLGMVDHLTIVVENVKPSGWAAEAVSYQLNGSIEGTRTFGGRFDQTDFRDTVGPREFQVASFNDVEGVTADDLDIRSLVTGFDGADPQLGRLQVTYVVDNTAGKRVPSVLLQYGWRVNGEGRHWRVADVGDIPAGASREVDVELFARQDSAFRTGTIDVHAGVFVGETANWSSFTTSRSDLDDL